ncbi:UDP-4-amino-4,6-dideoxy-N-acetyl-beta-L-altrosamine N-acetyltransferase [Halobacillus litoralis]|uniref:UDP-4-amino-4, 6-dideoxy-N-acetyl-beta-L-altrosamine N-acetyltransferase n=1 Tax=Halobacillus litoralis TaxID=45668 RepID=A0A410MBU5_9BACI|nr:UDP-4-amino-4,6-dideoxy-N-acetyl-beta-L-altrosamine N-acetyltransferase [Halobacillus litoralis]QAS52153.1 UDP-4-amino-4,6-dideoxy-N-acetyl-beta-L-altrosamine N-acetyltransferase [Halobacillus litoralis]
MTDFLLRDMEVSDLKLVWKWRNREEIRKNMYNDQPIPWLDHVDWFDREKKNPLSYTKLFLGEGRPLGVVRFTDIDLEHHTCYWGFYIGEKDTPKGSGTMMGRLALDFIFSEVDVRKVCAEVLGFNKISVRFHEKLGFLEEGRLKEQIRRGDDFIDVIPMGLFYNRWKMIRKALGGMDNGHQGAK